MEKNLYRGVVVLATALSLIGAILLFAGAGRAGLGLLGIALASLPFLMHLQTQRIVAISRTSESRVEKAIVRRLKGLPDLENSAEVNAIAAHLRKAVEDLKEDTTESTLSATANEFRRETRMTRLIMTELLDASRAGNPRGDQ